MKKLSRIVSNKKYNRNSKIKQSLLPLLKQLILCKMTNENWTDCEIYQTNLHGVWPIDCI